MSEIKKKYGLTCFLFLIFSVSYFYCYASPPTKLDSIHFNNTALSGGSPTGTLYVRDSSSAVFEDCGYTIRKASICAYLNLGTLYKYGSAPFNSQITVTINGYSTFIGSSGLIQTWSKTLALNDTTPAELYLQDFTANYSAINRFVVSISGYSCSALVTDSFQLAFYYKENLSISPGSAVIVNIGTSGFNPVDFHWSTSCTAVPDYELQVLRLFNVDTSSTYTSDQTKIHCTVDWTQAMDIETANPDTDIHLTVAEGTGYYIWRIRPIWTQYPGGIADSRNWGAWATSDYVTGDSYIITSTTPTSDRFFYYQFDDSLNWIYSRTFSEGDSSLLGTRISEKITFANGLEQVKQNQVHEESQHRVLANQTVYDYSGRPALTTLTAPLPSGIDTLGYYKGLIENSGSIYTAANMDEDGNFDNPDSITSGPMVDYYSNTNADTTVANAEGFPFSRTLFENDGTSRVQEESGPAETHRLRPINAHTTKTFYSGVADAELIRIFGDEAPIDTTVHKTLSIDPNETATITYVDKEGKTLATCLAIGSDSLGSILDTLDEQGNSRFTVHDTLQGNVPYGDYGITSNKPIAFATPTTVVFHYTISGKQIELACPNFCRTCDYTIQILIHAQDTTYAIANHLMPAKACSSGQTWDTTFEATLDPGTYVIQKNVFANNVDPSTVVGDTSNVMTFLQEQLDSIQNTLQADAATALDSVNYYLSKNEMDNLYAYLHVNIDVNNPDSVFADSVIYFQVGCDSIAIPIQVCPENSCAGNPDFEGYFEDRWKDSASYIGTTGGYLNFMPGFAPHQFNEMIAHMIANGYNCQNLWTCWENLTQTYGQLKTLADTMPEFVFNPLNQFFNCTGKEYKGYSSDTAYYIGYAFEYFNYTLGNSPRCDSLMKTLYGPTSGWGQDSLDGSITNKKWEQYYGCVNGLKTSNDSTPSNYAAQTQCDCEETCENRFYEFEQSLIQMYHNDSMYVQGDVYYLQRDTTWGQQYGFSIDSLPSGFSDYIPLSQIECAAHSLVENAKKGCNLTIFKNESGAVDSVGSSAQRLAMQQSMTWNYELSLAPCGDGYTKIAPPSDADTSFVKLWEQHYGGNKQDELWSMTPDSIDCGGALLGGFTRSSESYDVTAPLIGINNYWVVKVNQEGNVEWNKTIGGTKNDFLSSVIQTSDGGYLIGGTSNSGISGDKSDSARWGSYDYWVVKLDMSGNIQWNKTYGGKQTDSLMSLVQTPEGNYLLGGFTYSDSTGDMTHHNHGGADYWLVKIDANGNKIWDKNYGTSSNDYLRQVIVTKDNHYLLGGSTYGGANGDKTHANYNTEDYWILKTDSAGNQQWDKNYGGCPNSKDLVTRNVLTSIQETDAGTFALIGASNATNGSCRAKKTVANRGEYDYWVLAVNDNAVDTVISQADYGGIVQEDYIADSIVQPSIITQLVDSNFLAGGSSASDSSGNKTTHNYGSYDYWINHTAGTTSYKWDRDFGGTKADYQTAMFQDHDGNYWIAGYSYSDSTGNKTTHNYNSADTTADYWVLKGRDYCTHDTLCFKWIPTGGPIGDTTFMNPISCDSMSSQIVYNTIIQELGQMYQNHLNAYSAQYKAVCANPDSIKDTLSLSYTLGYYHYTLYYYDRAGNLVRTVPPKGVDMSSTTRMQHPNHTYVTKYSYNSLHELVSEQTPDGGLTNFWYDYKHELRFSQNAQQLAQYKYSYTKYDNLGRVIEVGESTKDSLTFTDSINNIGFPTIGAQRTYTVYSEPFIGTNYFGQGQTFLENRVSYTYTDGGIYTYYSYDPHGNVDWLIQDIPGLGQNYLGYTYDQISNKVLQVDLNDGQAGQFHYRYRYDADQRLLTAQSSQGAYLWDNDATYSYYLHGPLKRLALGQDHIQGMDYVYTIEGWIKGINYVTSNANDDPGLDNNDNFSKDVFGMVLSYDGNDFNRAGSPYNPSSPNLISSQSGNSFLFNGNISSWNLKKDSTGLATDSFMTAYQYRYDVLNRITQSNYNKYSSSWQTSNNYKTRYKYDPNGNITGLLRNAYTPFITMDSLTYHFNSLTNQLNYVTDTVPAGRYPDDLDNQSPNNYLYDKIGNLNRDVSAGIDTVTWTVYGKLQSVVKTNGDTISYVYDAAQNRVEKTVHIHSQNPVITYYVRDAQGNILSMYTRTVVGSNYDYIQTEVPLYGSARLGEWKPNILVKTFPTSGIPTYSCISCPVNLWTIDIGLNNGFFPRKIFKKEYELDDHLGNVHTIVSDRKNADSTAFVISYNDYYPGGMLMPRRNYQDSLYTFGFNSMMKDNEIYGTGNAYTTEFRELDPRLGGRWWSLDPITKAGESPYVGFSDNPIFYSDPEGADPTAGDPGADIHSSVRNLTSSSSGSGAGSGGLNSLNNLPTFTVVGKRPSWFSNALKSIGNFFKNVGNSIQRAYNSTLGHWHSSMETTVISSNATNPDAATNKWAYGNFTNADYFMAATAGAAELELDEELGPTRGERLRQSEEKASEVIQTTHTVLSLTKNKDPLVTANNTAEEAMHKHLTEEDLAEVQIYFVKFDFNKENNLMMVLFDEKTNSYVNLSQARSLFLERMKNKK